MPNGDSKGLPLTPKSMCCIIDSHWLTLEIWQIPCASVFPPEKGTNDTYLPLRTLRVLAGNFRLLQDKICLICAKNYCSLPLLSPAISFICTYTSQGEMQGYRQNEVLFGGRNWLPELLKQSCHTAVELSSGWGPCLELLSHSWHHASISCVTTFDATLWSDIVLQLPNSGKACQKLLSANSERGWSSTISIAGCWERKNLLTTSVLWHVALTTRQEFSFKQKVQ